MPRRQPSPVLIVRMGQRNWTSHWGIGACSTMRHDIPGRDGRDEGPPFGVPGKFTRTDDHMFGFAVDQFVEEIYPKYRENFKNNGMKFVFVRVPKRYVKRGTKQVLFRKSRAKIVAEVPADVIPQWVPRLKRLVRPL